MYRVDKMRFGFMAAVVAAASSGCVIVVEESGDLDHYWAADWDDENRARATANAELESRVRHQLESDAGLRDEEILVRARGSEVTLSGRVTDQHDFDRAIDLAAHTDGVTKVIARITVVVAAAEL